MTILTSQGFRKKKPEDWWQIGLSNRNIDGPLAVGPKYENTCALGENSPEGPSVEEPLNDQLDKITQLMSITSFLTQSSACFMGSLWSGYNNRDWGQARTQRYGISLPAADLTTTATGSPACQKNNRAWARTMLSSSGETNLPLTNWLTALNVF